MNGYPCQLNNSVHRIARSRSGASRKVARGSYSNVLANAGGQLLHLFKRAVLFGIAALFVVAIFMGINALREIQTGEIQIYGYSGSDQSNRGVSLTALNAIIAPYREQRYWRVDMRQLQRELEANTWVRKATLFRQWPNKIVIGIDEQLPIARWNTSHLLASSGELIVVDNAALFSSLPQFVTSVYQEGELSGNSESASAYMRAMVEHYNSFQQLLVMQRQHIVELGVSGAGDTWLVTDEGVRIELGKDRQLERLRRLVSLVDHGVIAGWKQIAVADLRYEQGVSVYWVDSDWEEDLESLTPLAMRGETRNKRKIKADWSRMHG